jgi:hypothetical protein
MKGVWAFLKTREWSVAIVPQFDPELIFLTKPWALVLYCYPIFRPHSFRVCICTIDCVRYLWVPRRYVILGTVALKLLTYHAQCFGELL